jgi:hypothetical protein
LYQEEESRRACRRLLFLSYAFCTGLGLLASLSRSGHTLADDGECLIDRGDGIASDLLMASAIAPAQSAPTA